MEHLFGSNDITKVKITNRCKSLLQGDWSRYHKPNRLNLDKYLGKEMMLDTIFDSIIDELKLESKRGDYSMNFNPNWFFIFYKEFYESKIFDIIPVKNKDDIIIGIELCPKSGNTVRIETIKIIELHSRFLLNNSVIKILGEEKFLKYFVENCYIQYKIQDNMYNNSYIDLCYVVENTNLLLEINEYHHNEINDTTRQKNIIINSNSRLTHYNTNDYFYTNDNVYKNMIRNMCKIIYNNNNTSDAIKIFLTEINNMPYHMINVGVSLYKDEYKLLLSDLLTIPFFDPTDKLSITSVIKSIIKKGNVNSEQDFSTLYTKDITLENIVEDMNTLELTSYGIKNFLLSINGKKWSRRKDYIEFMDNLEKECYKVIEEIIKDDTIDMLQQETIMLKNILGLVKYDQNTFFEKASKMKLFKNILHKTVPFIVKTEEKVYVDYSLLSNVLDSNIKSKINCREFGDNRYITNFRLMLPSELNRIFE
jgi:hypothetical protein